MLHGEPTMRASKETITDQRRLARFHGFPGYSW